MLGKEFRNYFCAHTYGYSIEKFQTEVAGICFREKKKFSLAKVQVLWETIFSCKRVQGGWILFSSWLFKQEQRPVYERVRIQLCHHEGRDARFRKSFLLADFADPIRGKSGVPICFWQSMGKGCPVSKILFIGRFC